MSFGEVTGFPDLRNLRNQNDPYTVTLARLLIGATLATLVATIAPAPDPSQAQVRLRQAGALNCAATRSKADDATTKLDCILRLGSGGREQARFEGQMSGNGLYLVSPGQIRVVWNVLAPTRSIEPGSLPGHYGRSSRHQFQYVRKNSNVLVGGPNGVIVLELIAPRVDPFDSSTKLTLRRAK